MVDEKLAEYRKRAAAKRTIKNVSFNNETEWVKEKIREEMQK